MDLDSAKSRPPTRQPGADRSGSEFQLPQPKLTGFTGQKVTGPPAIGLVVTGQHKSSYIIESSDVDMSDVQLDDTASLQAQLRSVQAQLQEFKDVDARIRQMPIPEQETLSVVRAADKRMREAEARYNEGTERIQKTDEWEAQTNQTAMGFVKQRNDIKKENQKLDRRKEDEARRLGDEVARRVREVELREDEVGRGDFEEPKRGMQSGRGGSNPPENDSVSQAQHQASEPHRAELSIVQPSSSTLDHFRQLLRQAVGEVSNRGIPTLMQILTDGFQSVNTRLSQQTQRDTQSKVSSQPPTRITRDTPSQLPIANRQSQSDRTPERSQRSPPVDEHSEGSSPNNTPKPRHRDGTSRSLLGSVRKMVQNHGSASPILLRVLGGVVARLTSWESLVEVVWGAVAAWLTFCLGEVGDVTARLVSFQILVIRPTVVARANLLIDRPKSERPNTSDDTYDPNVIGAGQRRRRRPHVEHETRDTASPDPANPPVQTRSTAARLVRQRTRDGDEEQGEAAARSMYILEVSLP
jgi:hypothetical protein